MEEGRYWLFGWDDYDAVGGLGDIIIRSDNLIYVLSYARELPLDNIEIYDSEKNQVVQENDYGYS